jgi:hypothetical protein
MTIITDQAIESVRANIDDMRHALSQSSCDRLHTDVLGYCKALHAAQVIDEEQCLALMDEADKARRRWRRSGHATRFE